MQSLPLNVTVSSVDGATATLVTDGGHAFPIDGARLGALCVPGTSLCLRLEEVVGWQLREEERIALSKAMLHEMLTVP